MRKTIKLLCGCALSMAMFHTSASAADQKFHITVLSSRPEMISGGDALVQVAAPAVDCDPDSSHGPAE